MCMYVYGCINYYQQKNVAPFATFRRTLTFSSNAHLLTDEFGARNIMNASHDVVKIFQLKLTY